MRKQSEALLILPLLPIFLAGLFPILMLALLGFAGLGLLGILLICAGLTDALDAHSDFNQHIIVDGYVRRTEQVIHVSNLHSAVSSASAVRWAGAALIAASIAGIFVVG